MTTSRGRLIPRLVRLSSACRHPTNRRRCRHRPIPAQAPLTTHDPLRDAERGRASSADWRCHDRCRTQRQDIVVAKAGSHAPASAVSAGDSDGRPVGQGEEAVPGVLDWQRREPEHRADRRGHALPGVGGRAQGTAHPSARSILGLKLTASRCGRRSLPGCDRGFDRDR
jgi:hypothetical protein